MEENISSKYIDNKDGTITDTVTGLMWKKCYEGLSGTNCEIGELEKFTWEEAMARAEEINREGFAGYKDWKVPNIKELKSIVKEDCMRPIGTNFFPNTPSLFVWSSSSCFYNSSYAWLLYFDSGSDYSINKRIIQAMFVLCVPGSDFIFFLMSKNRN